MNMMNKNFTKSRERERESGEAYEGAKGDWKAFDIHHMAYSFGWFVNGY